MKTLFTFLLLLVSTIIYSQTYESNITSHWFKESDSKPVKEEMRRKINIAERTITITSYGKNATDSQKWMIQDKIAANADTGVIEIFNTYLASGEPNEYPATFTFYYKNNKLDFINVMIPSKALKSLPEGSPIGSIFYISN